MSTSEHSQGHITVFGATGGAGTTTVCRSLRLSWPQGDAVRSFQDGGVASDMALRTALQFGPVVLVSPLTRTGDAALRRLHSLPWTAQVRRSAPPGELGTVVYVWVAHHRRSSRLRVDVDGEQVHRIPWDSSMASGLEPELYWDLISAPVRDRLGCLASILSRASHGNGIRPGAIGTEP